MLAPRRQRVSSSKVSPSLVDAARFHSDSIIFRVAFLWIDKNRVTIDRSEERIVKEFDEGRND